MFLPFLLKRVYSTRTEIAPYGSNFFPCRVDTFSKECLAGKPSESNKSGLPFNRWHKSTKCIQSVLKWRHFLVFSVSLLRSAKRIIRPVTSPVRSSVFVKSGGYRQAELDFYSLRPTDIVIKRVSKLRPMDKVINR